MISDLILCKYLWNNLCDFLLDIMICDGRGQCSSVQFSLVEGGKREAEKYTNRLPDRQSGRLSRSKGERYFVLSLTSMSVYGNVPVAF